MKRWVFAFRVEPPVNETVSARFGASVFFAAYSKILDQWYLIAGSLMEKISEPQMLYLDEEYVRQHPRDFALRPEKRISLRAGKKPVQLTFL